jgi:hypothetical protein
MVLPDVIRIFTSADGSLFSETYNQLNAYFAIVPGSYKHNLRKLFLLNSTMRTFHSCLRCIPARRGTGISTASTLPFLKPTTTPLLPKSA